MTTEIWLNIGADNGLLPDNTKPLPEPILTYYPWVLWHSHDNNSQVNTPDMDLWDDFENCIRLLQGPISQLWDMLSTPYC